MTLFAISLTAEELVVVLTLGRRYLSPARLRALSNLEGKHHLALHAAQTDPDPALLKELARWQGYQVIEAQKYGQPTLRFQPETPSRRRPADPSVNHPLYRGGVMAVVEITGEEPPTRNRSRRWFIREPVAFAPVALDTGDYPIGTPWQVLNPHLELVRTRWLNARRRTQNTTHRRAS